MPADTLIERLLDEISESGRTPEEVCADRPDLLPEVLRRWRHLREFEAELDAFFPSDRPEPGDDASPSRLAGGLPQIPGYDVETVLGRGGMGVVYRARQHRLNRAVALKMLLSGAYAGAHERSRFQREAEAVARLRHPNIVAIYDVGDHDGCPYFTMELLEGGSLAQALAGTPQPAVRAAAILATLAEAVQAAHRAGIVHRDLKPANILMAADGTPKVADFGLARASEAPSLTRSDSRLGTPSYMPPEQVIGKAGTVGPAADIYALGAVLYEALTGRPPFRGETAAETERQVVSEEPVSPSRLNRKVPADLETICLKCLSKEPQRRYADAVALADDLRRFADGRPILARPLGRVERSWRWGRRHPSSAGLLAAVLALVGLASGVGVWLLQQRVERRNEIHSSLDQAANLRRGYHFHEAQQLLDQALQRVSRAGADGLRRRVERARADVILAERLDKARTPKVSPVEGYFVQSEVEGPYLSAFADAGLGRVGGDVETAAAAVRSSALREEIVAALDDWASLTQDLDRQTWILAVARDTEPDDVFDRLRRPELWHEPAKLARAAEELKVAESSPQLATSLARVLRAGGQDVIPLLSAVQRRSPQDFWVNMELGLALHQAGRRDEAIAYVRVAVALRPDFSLPYVCLGNFLKGVDRPDDAIEALEHALALDPGDAWAHNNLAVILASRGRPDEALRHARRAVDLAPRDGDLRCNLGAALMNRGRPDEGIEELRRAVSLTPTNGLAHVHLGSALKTKGHLDEAADHLRQALGIDPKLDQAHTQLAVLERDRGRPEQAVDHRRRLVRWNGQASLELLTDLAVERYQAAVAYAQTTGGHDESERARRRSLALGWMRENLELTAALRDAGRIPRWSLTSWLAEPAFAAVRDPSALSKLPDAERESWRRLWDDVAAAIAADPLEQGRMFAARREWGRAADGYARSLTRGPADDDHFWYEFAALSLLSGDRPSHTRTCARMRLLCKAGAGRPYLLARACTLAPTPVGDDTQPGRLADQELKSDPGAFWSLTEQGALAYREGRFRQASSLFERGLRSATSPGAAVLDWLWLGLAKHRLGETDEASRWLDRARAWLDQYPDGMPARAEQELGLHLHNWLEAHVLLLEAEELIRLDARRDGTMHPESRPPGSLPRQGLGTPGPVAQPGP